MPIALGVSLRSTPTLSGCGFGPAEDSPLVHCKCRILAGQREVQPPSRQVELPLLVHSSTATWQGLFQKPNCKRAKATAGTPPLKKKAPGINTRPQIPTDKFFRFS